MKTFVSTLILILVICLSGCDGRNRVYKTNTEVLIENKLLDSFSEKITYIPEGYVEVATDTILSNGFQVKLKTYTNMEQSVLHNKTQDSINYKTYYRDYTSELIVTKNSKEIFNSVIDKHFFKRFKNNINLANSIIKLTVDEASCLKKNAVVLSVLVEKTTNKHIQFYNLRINAKGELKLTKDQARYAYTY